MKNNRYIAIDLLRGASMLYIVGFWHLFNYTTDMKWYANTITFRFTVVVLSVFVMISGYLTGAKAIDFTFNNILCFYKKRFYRIYPPYFLTIAIFFFLGIGTQSSLIKSTIAISIFVKPSPPTLWFITMLIPFYLIAPFLVNLSKKIIIFFMVSVALFVFMFLYEYTFHNLDVRLMIYFPAFCVGIFLARNKEKMFNFNTLFFVASIISFFFSFIFGKNVQNSFTSIPLAIFPALYIIIIFIKYNDNIPNLRIIYFISSASYFMYLFHRPFYTAFKNISFPVNDITQVLYLVFVCLPMVIIFSWFGQKIYDVLLKYFVYGEAKGNELSS